MNKGRKLMEHSNLIAWLQLTDFELWCRVQGIFAYTCRKTLSNFIAFLMYLFPVWCKLDYCYCTFKIFTWLSVFRNVKIALLCFALFGWRLLAVTVRLSNNSQHFAKHAVILNAVPQFLMGCLPVTAKILCFFWV